MNKAENTIKMGIAMKQNLSQNPYFALNSSFSTIKPEAPFPIMQFLEHKMPLLFSGFHHEVMPKSYFPPDTHGETSIEERLIRIREDVYLGAIQGMGRDRMTVAHEVGHYILLVAKGLKLYRSFAGSKPDAFRDPEWQAKAFAGELLCPYHLIGGMAAPQIALACGVSDEAAGYHFKLKNPATRRF